MESDPITLTQHRPFECPEYCFDIDEYKRGSDQFLVAHLRVHHWSASTLREMRKKWRIFRQCVTAPLFALAEVDDDKWSTFVSLFGFKPHSSIVCNNGERRRLFIHQVIFPNAVTTANKQHTD